MKMPVPTVAPMPNSESWNSPIVRASSPSPVSAPVSSAITPTGLRRQICSPQRRRGRLAALNRCHRSSSSSPRYRDLRASSTVRQPSQAPSCVAAFGVSTGGRTRPRARGCPPWPRQRRCAGSPRSARSSAPTRRRSTSSRRRRSTCSASTAGCGTSSTSTTSTRSRAATRACSSRTSGRTASSSRWRTSATTCSATRRSSTACTARGPGGKCVFVMFDDETEKAAAAAGPRGRPPVGRAAPPARLEDRHHAARQRGRRAERAEHARARDDLRRADGARRVGRARRRPRRPDAVRRLRQDDVLHPRRARLGQERRRHGRPGAEGHEADQQPRGGGRGRAHAPRHDRRPADDRPHRPPGADAAQGRLVRQRHLPRGAVARAPRARARAHAAARRPARGGGLPRLPRDRLPRRRRHRRALPGRDQPAHQRRDLDDERDRRRLRRRAAVPVPPARVPGRRLRDRRRRHQPPLGARRRASTSGARSSSRTPATRSSS